MPSLPHNAMTASSGHQDASCSRIAALPVTSGLLDSVVAIPNLLSLDAPLVAISWQWLLWTAFHNSFTSLQPSQEALANSHFAPLDAPTTIALFASVWLIYMADRLLDCRRLNFDLAVSPRHRFAHRWSAVLWPLWSLIFIAVGCNLLLHLRLPTILAGGVLALVVLTYNWTIHGSRTVRRRVPKEIIVGCVFACGTSLPTSINQLGPRLVVSTCLLAALFSLNCMCVAMAQRPSDATQGCTSTVLLFPGLAHCLPLFATSLALLSTSLFLLAIVPQQLAVCIGLSAMALAILAIQIRRDTGWMNAMRSSQLADFALLTPLIVLFATP